MGEVPVRAAKSLFAQRSEKRLGVASDELATIASGRIFRLFGLVEMTESKRWRKV
jgi:hypothetical protein